MLCEYSEKAFEIREQEVKKCQGMRFLGYSWEASTVAGAEWTLWAVVRHEVQELNKVFVKGSHVGLNPRKA